MTSQSKKTSPFTTTPDLLKKSRLKANLTQSQAAELIHVDIRTWQKYEAGDRTMHPAFVELYANKIYRKLKGSVELGYIQFTVPSATTNHLKNLLDEINEDKKEGLESVDDLISKAVFLLATDFGDEWRDTLISKLKGA